MRPVKKKKNEGGLPNLEEIFTTGLGLWLLFGPDNANNNDDDDEEDDGDPEDDGEGEEEPTDYSLLLLLAAAGVVGVLVLTKK